MTRIRSVVVGLLLGAFFIVPALAQTGKLGSGQVWGNAGASAAVGTPSDISALFDRKFGSSPGSMLYRGASAWAILPGGVGFSAGTFTGLPNPTLNSDVANKQYVDATAQGLHVLATSTYATAAVLPNSPTYSNGASGVGATLTAGSNTTLTVDGNVGVLNDVVLVKNQASTFQNGIYKLTTVGSGAAAWVLTRVTYFDQAAEILAGSSTLITSGATNIGSTFVLQTTVVTVGTDAVVFNQFSTSRTSVPTTAVSGASTSLSASHCGQLVARSASGSVMTDTLSTTGLASGCVIYLKNADATAPYQVTVSGGTLDGVASGFLILGVGQAAAIEFDGTNFRVMNKPVRISSGPSGITFYVAASGGSDSNSGLVSGSPFATRQKCWNLVQQSIDLGGTPFGNTGFTCQMADGTYTDATMQAVGSITGQDFAAKVVFQGNCTTPGNVVVNVAGISYTGDDKAMFALRCQRITTSLNGSNLVFVQHGGTLLVVLDKMEMLGGAATGSHFVAQLQAQIVFTAAYKILGGGAGCSWVATSQGNVIVLNSFVVDQTAGGINFSSGWACASDLGYLSGVGLSFNGGSSGPRYSVTNNSIINSGGGGANFFSGSVAGSASGGGIYE